MVFVSKQTDTQPFHYKVTQPLIKWWPKWDILGDFQINCSCIEFSNFFFQVQKANTFLVDALKTFENEGWSLLKVQTLTDTAKCYENLNDWEKLLRTCAQIACANQLVTSDQKLQYCQKFRDIASQHIGKIILIIPQCLKTTEKVSFIIASEASFVYILNPLKMPKIVRKPETHG